MSVINKMLQDLEQRQPHAIDAGPKPPAAPPVAVSYNWRVLTLVFMLMVCVILAWFWQPKTVQALPQAPILTDTLILTNTPILTNSPIHTNRPVPAATLANRAEPANIVLALNAVAASAAASADMVKQPKTVVNTPEPLPLKPQPQPQLTVTPQPQLLVDKAPLSDTERQLNMRMLANASEAAGDTGGAIVVWQQILAKQPAQSEAYLNLARLWLTQQQIVSASQVLLQARQNGVLSAEINMQLAQLAIRQGNWQQALDFLPAEFQLANEPEYFGLKATVLQQLQQFSAAHNWYQRLHQLQPEQGRWSLGAALVSEQLGLAAEAHQYYQRAWQQRQALSASSHDFIQQRLKATEP
jgi:tetratricopeptide (TPR) repeat protein